MTRIVHLSDLHLGANEAFQQPLFASLIQALRGHKADLLVFTGDIFNSAKQELEAVDKFLALLEHIDAQVGPKVPTIILPGNHDRREDGILAPLNGALFARLAEQVAGLSHIRVLGCTPPFLSYYLEVPGIPAHVVVYDSTFLPSGLFSAGGMMRQEDLIEVSERMLDPNDDKPLLFLVHHHLVPTPITDFGEILTDGRGPIVGWAVKHLLPSLVANADREELTMTALGSGTALSTLHALGRAVVVLHGHKHYPTARLLKGTAVGEGDVMLLAAGSCGTSERWQSSTQLEAPRLWPSFNVLELEGSTLRAQSIAFPSEVDEQVWERAPRVNRRPLLSARRNGKRWELDEPALEQKRFEPLMTLNASTMKLVPGAQSVEVFDLEVVRELKSTPSKYLTAYHELVEGLPGSKLTRLRNNKTPVADLKSPANLELPLLGTFEYTLLGGVVASLEEATRQYGAADAAFEWVGLLNRYRSELARITVQLAPIEVAKQRPFASVTDLTTGRERPVLLQRDDEHRKYWFEVAQCPARTLLRVYWPLAGR